MMPCIQLTESRARKRRIRRATTEEVVVVASFVGSGLPALLGLVWIASLLWG